MKLEDNFISPLSNIYISLKVKLFGVLLLQIICFWSVTAQKRATKLPKILQEVSGIVYQPDDMVWAINDGGNPALLYKFDLKKQKVVSTMQLPVPNRDWEDLQMDARGNLWIGDIGNNMNRRKDLRFYRFDPVTQVLDSVLFVYEDQRAFPPQQTAAWNYDCEAFVWLDDTLHLFTKSRFKGHHFTKHYTVPARPGVWTAMLQDSMHLPNRVVSGAALDHTGTTLALTTYFVRLQKWRLPYTRASVFFFTDYAGTHFFEGKMKKKHLPKCWIARQFESVTHKDGNTWLAANEGIFWQKPRIWRIKNK